MEDNERNITRKREQEFVRDNPDPPVLNIAENKMTDKEVEMIRRENKLNESTERRIDESNNKYKITSAADFSSIDNVTFMDAFCAQMTEFGVDGLPKILQQEGYDTDSIKQDVDHVAGQDSNLEIFINDHDKHEKMKKYMAQLQGTFLFLYSIIPQFIIFLYT